VKHLGVDVGVGYFSFIDTDMVRGADDHPSLGGLRAQAGWPVSKTYPLSGAGRVIADGIEGRRRWVVYPSWGRALLVLRTALAPLLERASRSTAAEADALFVKDVKERGAAAASGPVGAGGQAARSVAPETPRGGEAEGLAEPEREPAAG
jgi:hypothetical protein